MPSTSPRQNSRCVRSLSLLVGLTLAWAVGSAETSTELRIDAYLKPYVTTQNFSGTILIAQGGKVVFARAYGMSDANRRAANRLTTRFHVASMSMQFTAAAVLRLIDAGRLTLDAPVSSIIPEYPHGAITIRQLLTQTSGIADINDLPGYDELLKSHQDAASLVAKTAALPPLRRPGLGYSREEHSAYNLLALIVERETGQSFRDALERLVFAPLGMKDSGIDDDRKPPRASSMAVGYSPVGVRDLKPAEAIHWSGKTGNGSAYSTVLDEQKWLQGLVNGRFLLPASRSLILDVTEREGYGWFKAHNKRFDAPLYYMNGRAPGFASAIAYFPQQQLSLIVLSNIYASVTTDLAYDVAALTLGKPATSFRPINLSTQELSGAEGVFRFGKDFYQPEAALRLRVENNDAFLQWPQGSVSALIPVGNDRFIDRSYWVVVELVRSPESQAVRLKYDHFVGERLL